MPWLSAMVKVTNIGLLFSMHFPSLPSDGQQFTIGKCHFWSGVITNSQLIPCHLPHSICRVDDAKLIK